jgi:hypothetical protein
MKSISLVVIGFLFSGSVSAQNPDSGKAVELVRAMRADVLILEAAKAGVSRATREGQFTAAQFQCFDQLTASALTSDMGKVLSQVLTRDEIVNALEFYASPVGVKFMDMKFVALARQAATSGVTFGGKPSVPEPAMTVDEIQAAREFIESSLGTKIETDKLLLRSPEVDKLAKRVVGRKLESCGAKVPPLP